MTSIIGGNMGGIKRRHTFELNENHLSWLTEMTKKYAISDEDKALRIVIDYVMDETDQAAIFTEVRCNHCHDTKNQD